MKVKVKNILDQLIERYPVLESSRADIETAYEIMKDCYDKDGKLLIAGNGGSCADAQHIVGELMKGFCKKRCCDSGLRSKLEAFDIDHGAAIADNLQKGLMAISLTDHQALSTAFANDLDPVYVYAQQLYGYARKNDVFLAISTSGNSKNVCYAVSVAKALGIKVIALTGKDGGKLKAMADCSVIAPSNETYMIQELHLPIYHALCLMLEETYFEV